MSATIRLDPYIVDVLMPDLVGHDRQPSAFLVYLYLWRRGAGHSRRATAASLQQIASDIGISKSAVQQALRTLMRRQLLERRIESATAVPEYRVSAPWARRR